MRVVKIFFIVLSFSFFFFVWIRFIVPNLLTKERVPFSLDGLSEDTRAVLISDLHSLGYGEKERRVVEEIRELEPEVLFIAGDLVDWKATDLESMARFWSDLVRVVDGPTYVVLGNHDHRSPLLSGVKDLIKESGMELLVNEKVDFRGLSIVGVDDPHLGLDDFKWEGADILLAHSPEIYRKVKDKEVDLILVGHTHGCQVKLPIICNWIVPLNYDRQFKEGLFKLDETSMYVTRGAGESFLAIRFNARPEITVLDLSAKKRSSMLFVGDIMLDRGVEERVSYIFEEVRSFLEGFDLVFGNLESVISDKGEKIGSIYSFRAEPEAVEALNSFDLVSVANNHSFDYGREAFLDSKKRLESAGIGAVDNNLVIRDVNGTKVGFLAYTLSGSSKWELWLESKDRIRESKKEVDILVVSLHFGEEYEEVPSAGDRKIAREIINAGADLLIGHHPHVVRPVERYNGGYIAYSLGNFVFDQGFSEETMRGLALEVVLEEGGVARVIEHSVSINKSFQPTITD